MTLAEFRRIYTSPLSTLNHVAVLVVHWPAWVQFAQWALETGLQQQEGGGDE